MKKIKKMCAVAALLGILTSSCTSQSNSRAYVDIVKNEPPIIYASTLEKECYHPPALEPTIEYQSIGVYRLSAYCPCIKCCGKTDGITASGARAQANHTVAMSGFPFGTRLLIEGQEYVVEDRGGGLGSRIIDIFYNTHEEALHSGLWRDAEVFMIIEK